MNRESHKHHFVPRFLLNAWAANGMLRGYHWDRRRNSLICKTMGAKAFCWRIDLLTLAAHHLGRDALEQFFFSPIDAKGAEARAALLDGNVDSLTEEERSDFARLLLSLEARRPAAVQNLRAMRAQLADGLDQDPEILAAMAREGVTEIPSLFAERQLGVALEDRVLALIQRMVDNPLVGKRLINAHWHIVHLGQYDGTFILGDRPLIRTHAYDHPGSVWALPIDPKAAFVAANHLANLRIVQHTTGQRFAKSINVSSANQAERFIFSVDATHERWVGKYLRAKVGQPG